MFDALHRPLHNLRLSVTDRCNLRCAYCMPEETYSWLPSPSVLSFEELSALVDVFIGLGVRKVRLTGGEPLVRRELSTLVGLLAKKTLDEVTLTTNGVLLGEHARALKAAGLTRLTVSLDTLHRARFEALTRRQQLDQVLEGLAEAKRVGLGQGLKLDTVLMRGVNDDEILELLEFAAGLGAELRFIEYMDVGGATRWSTEKVVTRAQVLERVTQHFGRAPLGLQRASEPAERFELPTGQVFGIIASTTQPFCGQCDRARVTADGRFFTCLYATDGVDLKTPLRANVPSLELETLVRSVWERRRDRGAEQRLELRHERGPSSSVEQLQRNPHLEMHTRGG